MVVNDVTVHDLSKRAEIFPEAGFVHSDMETANENLSSFFGAKFGLGFFGVHILFDIEKPIGDRVFFLQNVRADPFAESDDRESLRMLLV